MLDLVRPKVSGKITLADLKNCKMANIFFDTFFNLDKFLDHEQRDPFANARVSGNPSFIDDVISVVCEINEINMKTNILNIAFNFVTYKSLAFIVELSTCI